MKQETKIFELHYRLLECLDYFDQRADAEWEGEEIGMTPNEEMQMMQSIENTLQVCGLALEFTK